MHSQPAVGGVAVDYHAVGGGLGGKVEGDVGGAVVGHEEGLPQHQALGFEAAGLGFGVGVLAELGLGYGQFG